MKRFLESKYFKWGLTAFCVLFLIVIFVWMIMLRGSISQSLATFASLISPIIYGSVIGFILTPLVNAIERQILIPIYHSAKKSTEQKPNQVVIRTISLILTLAITIGLIWGFFAIVIPQVVSSISQIVVNIPTYYEEISEWTGKILENNPDMETLINNILANQTANLQSIMQEKIMPQATQFLISLSTGVVSFLKVIYNLLVGLIVSIYVLAAKERFAGQFRKLTYAIFPAGAGNKIIGGFRFIEKTFIGFFSGKILDSIIIGILCFIACLIMQIPYAVLVSVIIGVTNIIPFFGPFIGAVPTTLLVLLNDPVKALWFVIMVVILQQLDGNVIGPAILGESTGLSGFWVIFAITFFGGLWGVAGMLVGVPLFACFYALVKYIILLLLQKRRLPVDTAEYSTLDYIDNGTLIPLSEEPPHFFGKGETKKKRKKGKKDKSEADSKE